MLTIFLLKDIYTYMILTSTTLYCANNSMLFLDDVNSITSLIILGFNTCFGRFSLQATVYI